MPRHRRIGLVSQLVPPKATWTTDKVPDQTGKTVIITGGNIGIGKETAAVLLEKGARVYIATRVAEKAHAVIDELTHSTGKHDIFFLELNLADLDSVRAAAAEFRKREPELHTLYNNRGVTYTTADKKTEQGFDLIFGTNVLGHFYFTQLLLPVLKTTAEKSPAGTVRVVNMSSIAHYMPAPEGIRWSTLGPGDDAIAARRSLGGARLFGQSKLGNILFSNELAKRHGGDGSDAIVSISLFPGAVNADLAGHAGSVMTRFWKLLGTGICFILTGGDVEALAGDLPRHIPDAKAINDGVKTTAKTQAKRQATGMTGISEGDAEEPPDPSKVNYRAITPLFAGTDPEASNYNGKYLTAWARVTLPSKKAVDSRLAAKLWDWCEERVKEATEPKKDIKASEDTTVENDTRPVENIKVEVVARLREHTTIEEVTKHMVDSKVEEVASKVEGVVEGVASKVDGAVEGVASRVDGVVEGVASKVDGVVEGVASKVDGVVEGVASKVEGVASKVEGAASKVEGAASKVEGAASKVEGAASKVEEAANLKVEEVASKVDKVASKVEKGAKINLTVNFKVEGLGATKLKEVSKRLYTKSSITVRKATSALSGAWSGMVVPIKRHLRAVEAIKAEEAAKAEEATKPKEATKEEEATKPGEATKAGEATKPKEATKAEEATKAVEATKAEAVTKVEETTKVEAATKVEETTKIEAATKIEETTKVEETTKAKEDNEAREDTKSKE